jgi:cleavage stimulation factor subunit 3
MEELNRDVQDEANRMMGPEINPAAVPPAPSPEEEDQRDAEIQRLVDERLSRGEPVLARRQKEVDDLKTAISLVWIMYMRFARRAEVRKQVGLGTDISGHQSRTRCV